MVFYNIVKYDIYSTNIPCFNGNDIYFQNPLKYCIECTCLGTGTLSTGQHQHKTIVFCW